MEVFSNEEARSDTLSCRNTDVDEGLAMAKHTHRDFSIDALLPVSTSRDDHPLPSSESAKEEDHHRAHSQREAGRKRLSTRSRKREEYDPELEKLVRERVYDLHVRVQSLQTHEQQVLPSNERESPAAPEIPPRASKSGKSSSSNHTNNPASVTSKSRPLPPTPSEASISTNTASAKTCACGNCLGLLNGVCQQCSSGLVINGDHHDYINQNHLDAILEEQEGDTEVESSIVKRKRQDSEDGEDFMDEATADAVLSKAKERRGTCKVLAVHSYDQ